MTIIGTMTKFPQTLPFIQFSFISCNCEYIELLIIKGTENVSPKNPEYAKIGNRDVAIFSSPSIELKMKSAPYNFSLELKCLRFINNVDIFKSN
jgi:hypothetical protein